MLKRLFDFFSSLTALIFLLPFFFIVALLIAIEGGFPVFFTQTRIGKNKIPFQLLKFRTMVKDADKLGKITIGKRDPRVTNIGHFLRSYKLDELPQLLNILKGEMSVVGPRPEVQEYVDLYTEEQNKVFLAKPGLTDYASLKYINESEVLAKSSDPNKTYIEEVMPAKLQLNLKYIEEQGLLTDLKIIFKTIGKILS
jgi:lipopolysaccharide/colanic/teichoic acid biosynthesis glycosyltransferase